MCPIDPVCEGGGEIQMTLERPPAVTPPGIRHVDVPGYPGAHSPYSHAVVANGFVFVSGQIPVRPGGAPTNGKRHQHPILSWNAKNRKLTYEPPAHRRLTTRGLQQKADTGLTQRLK